jgi:hypothetical protein
MAKSFEFIEELIPQKFALPHFFQKNERIEASHFNTSARKASCLCWIVALQGHPTNSEV